MDDLDLVPAEWRRRRWLRRWLGRCALAWLVGVSALVAAHVSLGYGTESRYREAARFGAEAALSEHKRVRMDELTREQERLELELSLLEGLRGGRPAAPDLLRAIDDVLSDRVWFRWVRYRRGGALVDQPKEAVESGYFLVVPEGPEGAGARRWRVDTDLEIGGRAADHGALAEFVRGLSQRPEFASVRVLSTQSQTGVQGSRVDFELSIAVRERRS
jgi:hypothetical protein